MLDLPLNLSPSIKGPGIEQRAGGGSCGPARCNARKRLSLEHRRLQLRRNATVHNNERPPSPHGDVTTKVGNSTVKFRRADTTSAH
jgi:hypothetical protein